MHSFDWIEFIDLAERTFARTSVLLEQDRGALWEQKTQAALRTAISRAYYGAFQEAFYYSKDVERDPEISKGGEGDRDKKHKYIIKKYKDSAQDEQRKTIGVKLDSLRRRRNSVDYEKNLRLGLDELETAVHDARKVIEQLEQIKHRPRT